MSPKSWFPRFLSYVLPLNPYMYLLVGGTKMQVREIWLQLILESELSSPIKNVCIRCRDCPRLELIYYQKPHLHCCYVSVHI